MMKHKLISALTTTIAFVASIAWAGHISGGSNYISIGSGGILAGNTSSSSSTTSSSSSSSGGIGSGPAVTPYTTWVNVTPGGVNLSSGSCGNFGTETVQADDQNPGHVYTHFHCQGIWKSTDYGTTWTGPIDTGTNGTTARNCAGGIKVVPGNTAGSAPTIHRTCIRGATGYWRSTDGGVSWTTFNVAVTPSNRQDYYPPAVDPYDKSHLVMAGHEMNYIVESTNNGATWTNVPMNSGMNSSGGTGAIFFINTGSSGSTRTTWLWQAQAAASQGTWRTTSGGGTPTWTKVDGNEHPHGSSQIYQPDTSGIVFAAGVYGSGQWGIRRSTDYGVTWTPVGNGTSQMVVWGSPNFLYGMNSYPVGPGGDIGENYQRAPAPGITGWVGPSSVTGMANGAAQVTTLVQNTPSGVQYVFLSANWNEGVWRYAETPVSSGIALLGNPTSTIINGLATITDRLSRTASHAVTVVPGSIPSGLASESKPTIPDVKVLIRGDSAILYLPNVLGAGDYRAYVVSGGVSFVDTANGKQPRNAVVACAGFRMRHYDLELAGATPWRELMQTVELPGLTSVGSYTVVVEATSTPCPFTGMPAHTDASIDASDGGDPYAQYMKASFRSPATMISQYGNEIINGQGSGTSWTNRLTAGVIHGLPVNPASTEIPKDPVVIARNVITLTTPAADEAVNSPRFDLAGANSVFDDFATDYVIPTASITNNSELTSGGNKWFAPLMSIPGKWTFWGNNIQKTDGANPFNGAQVFQRHGRLYQTSGDAIQCCMSSILFSSLETLPQELDQTNVKYVHSFFRVNSDATSRRYWEWLMCGDETREALVNTTTKMPTFRPVIDPASFDAMGTVPGSFTGKNPSQRHADEPVVAGRYNKECLHFIQHGVSEPHWPSPPTRERFGSRLMLVLHPKDVPQGVMSLAPNGTDFYTSGFPGWTHRTNNAGTYTGPMLEPFDQFSPLIHVDLFVRPNRVVAFVNGRQVFCVDLSTRPLEMKYGLIMYGNALYHTAAEASEAQGTNSADYNYRLNIPIADTRAWDAVGHSEMIDIPTSIFTTFDATQCRAPKSTAVL